MIYLDTHIVTALDRRELRGLDKEARRLLEQDFDLRVSPMVLVELDFLHEIGRIDVSARTLLDGLRKDVRFSICDRPFADVALAAAAERWTRDPFDRIIVAQARIAKAPLISRDTTIQSHYGRAVG